MHGRTSYGFISPSCIAASAVTGLNVDPGGYAASIARLMPGWFAFSAATGSSSGASFFGSLRPT